jgi:hypothetical protein
LTLPLLATNTTERGYTKCATARELLATTEITAADTKEVNNKKKNLNTLVEKRSFVPNPWEQSSPF